MTPQDRFYATKWTYPDLHLPLSTLKIRSFTIVRLAESAETLHLAVPAKQQQPFTNHRLAESTETALFKRRPSYIHTPSLSFDSPRVRKRVECCIILITIAFHYPATRREYRNYSSHNDIRYGCSLPKRSTRGEYGNDFHALNDFTK